MYAKYLFCTNHGITLLYQPLDHSFVATMGSVPASCLTGGYYETSPGRDGLSRLFYPLAEPYSAYRATVTWHPRDGYESSIPSTATTDMGLRCGSMKSVKQSHIFQCGSGMKMQYWLQSLILPPLYPHPLHKGTRGRSTSWTPAVCWPTQGPALPPLQALGHSGGTWSRVRILHLAILSLLAFSLFSLPNDVKWTSDPMSLIHLALYLCREKHQDPSSDSAHEHNGTSIRCTGRLQNQD